MARGTQFLQVVEAVRAEVRRSTNVAVGIDDLGNLKQVVNRTYKMLWWEHDWPHLTKYFDAVTLNAGQRYYNMPTGLSYERVKSVALWYSGLPQILGFGIGFDEYAVSNPDAGVRSEPALRWDIRYGDGVQEQFEIWPVPSASDQKIQFFGFGAEPNLVNNSDVLLLDDTLVTVHAAADILTAQKAEDATLKLQEAVAFKATLLAKTPRASQPVRMGQNAPSESSPRRAVVRIGGR